MDDLILIWQRTDSLTRCYVRAKMVIGETHYKSSDRGDFSTDW